MSTAPISPTSFVPAHVSARLSPLEHTRAAKLKGPALRGATPAEQRAAVAAQFEAILVRQMLGKTVTSMVGGGSGVAGSVYGDLLTETFAEQLSAGQGLGLGRMLEQQLTPRGEKAAATKELQ